MAKGVRLSKTEIGESAQAKAEQRRREICKTFGMPHAGLELDEEMEAMLDFFRSLNAILWYDVPTLRDLVILDPKWVIDASTCFIRDFKMKDHTERFERMNAIDQDAMRREPEAWSKLTDGSAILERRLLDVLWQEDDFEPHKAELLDLLTRFGLIVPVPRKSDAWIVPALLRETSRPEAPFGWPSRSPDAGRLMLRFSLDSGHKANELMGSMWPKLERNESVNGMDPTQQLVFQPNQTDAAGGFLPIGIFHRLCAGALGCSNQGIGGPELALERRFAYIAIDSELAILQHMPAISSILVTFMADGKARGAAVLDALRVLISQELGEYRNLQCNILAHYPIRGREAWIDLDVLARTPSTAGPFQIGGTSVSVEDLWTSLSFWLTLNCEFNFVLADKLRTATGFPKMLTLQQMIKSHPDWVVKRNLTFIRPQRRV